MVEEQQLILVNEQDEITGHAEKIAVHRQGLLHRAFSIQLLNSNNELLLQKRAVGKYHSGGLWTNACCSHPLKGETVLSAAQRRLREELGISCRLQELYRFSYRARLDNGFIEHELDHVLIGRYNGTPQPNPLEISAIRWMSLEETGKAITREPEQFTVWFRIMMEHPERFVLSD